MKFKYLFCGFVPARKCGAAAVAAPIVGSIAGAAIQSDTASSNVNKQLRAQSQENQINRDWQTQEAEKARQFEAGQVQQQNAFTREQAGIQQQYNMQSMKQQAYYNSPLYQRQMLQAAGINPQVYFGQQSSFSGSSPISGGTPGTPSPGSAPGVGSVQGLSPVGFQPTDLKVPELMSSFGSLMSGLANAKKSGVETTFLEESLEARVKEAIAKGDMAETAKVLQDLDLAFQRANFGTRLNHAYAQYKETLANIDLLSEKKLTEQEEQKLKRATADMNLAIKELDQEEKRKLGVIIPLLPGQITSEILKNRGQAAAGFASAQESKANAAVLKQEARIRTVAADVREHGKTKELQSVLDELDAKQAISQEQYKQACVLIKRLNVILDDYGTEHGRKEIDADLENLFKIIGLSTSVHN